jgi:predicted transposase YdaD
MADYSLRIYRKAPECRLIQAVIYLRETSSPLVHTTTFRANQLTNQFRTIRLWEQPTEFFFNHPGLLPYAVLTQSGDRPETLRQVAHKIATLTNPQQRSDLTAISAVNLFCAGFQLSTSRWRSDLFSDPSLVVQQKLMH